MSAGTLQLRSMARRLLSLLSLCLAPAAFADVKLPRLFSDSMVVQRGVRVPVWGTAAPNESVTVRLAGEEAKTTAGADGVWSVRLGAMRAGGPYTMTVAGANAITINNVMVGEVWLASGQSNMVFNLSTAANATQEIAAANYPRLRIFTVSQVTADAPRADVGAGVWRAATPATAGAFSAIGYLFGRKLMEELDVPVGIIVSAVNGTPAESWTSREGMAADPDLKTFCEQQIADFAGLTNAQQRFSLAMSVWEKQTGMRDPGDLGLGAQWALPSLDTRDWKRFWMPSYTYVTDLCSGGLIWFRKEVDIPAAMAGRNMTLALGAISDRDWVFYNGTMIGAGGTSGPLYSSTSRTYTVPAAIATAGRGVITIRTFAHTRNSGQLCSPGSTTLAANGVTLNLHGWWQSKVEHRFARQPAAMEAALPVMPVSSAASVSTKLFNGMIAPLIPYAVKGVIWYQGEQNSTRGAQYRKLFPALIRDWRSLWASDLPFYFVQLANFMGPETEPGEADWAEVREAQLLAAKSVKGAGMVVTIDIGTADNIHPAQ